MSYKRLFEDTINIPKYIKFVGNKFKSYEQILISSAINFYLKKLLGSKRNNIQLRVVPKDNIMKGTIANIVLDEKAMNNNFTFNINRNVSMKILLKFIAHEMVHVEQIVNKKLSTKDFKTLQWKGKDIVSGKDYNKMRSKDISQYVEFPHEKEAYSKEKELLNSFLKSNEFKNLEGQDNTLDFIIKNL